MKKSSIASGANCESSIVAGGATGVAVPIAEVEEEVTGGPRDSWFLPTTHRSQ
jgi:hypothetical protein